MSYLSQPATTKSLETVTVLLPAIRNPDNDRDELIRSKQPTTGSQSLANRLEVYQLQITNYKLPAVNLTSLVAERQTANRKPLTANFPLKLYICYMSNTTNTRTIHEGRNIKRFREMLQIKQEGLADMLGDDWTQKKVSQLEAKETIEPAILQEVAKALKIPAEAIQNFDEETAIYNISCTFSDNAMLNNRVETQNINPVEKWLEAIEEIKRLNAALLKEKDEKIALLERMMEKR